MSQFVLIVLGLLILGGGTAALYIGDTVSAIIASGVVSLTASLVYLLAGAPDVAMTEAAIGSALTTVVFLFAWARIRRGSGSRGGRLERGAQESAAREPGVREGETRSSGDEAEAGLTQEAPAVGGRPGQEERK